MKIRPHYLQHHMTARVERTRRVALYLLLTVLLISGAAWLGLHLNRSDDALPSPYEPWLMKIHGAASMLIIFFSGTLLYGHMLNAWHQGRNRSAGLVMAGSFLLIALTGYGLYYFDGELLRRVTEWLHWAVGFGLPLLLWWHVALGRKERQLRKAKAPRQPPL